MKTNHRGYEINAYKTQALGGWTNLYFSIVRSSDGLIVADSFTDGAESVRDIIRGLKSRVNEFIKSKGKSECMAKSFKR